MQDDDDTEKFHRTKRRHVSFIQTDPGAETKNALRSWFSGGRRQKMPKRAELMAADAVRKKVLNGWSPAEPVITRDTRVTAFGSCFAANISNYLGRRGYAMASNEEGASNAYVVALGEAMVNSFVIRQQFDWAWEGKTYDEKLWYSAEQKPLEYDEKVRLFTKDIFDKTDVFILTFGLSEVWYDAETDGVFLRHLPKDVFDPKRHKFRVTSVEENRENMEAIYQLIRKHAPHAKVIFTLSPIPLLSTFRDHSCVTANSVSKSILRVAIDEVVRAHQKEGHLFYWPSFEIIKEVLPNSFKPDGRHVRDEILAFIMAQFEHIWCKPAENDLPDLELAWARALTSAGVLPTALTNPLLRKNVTRMRHIIGRFASRNEVPEFTEVLTDQVLSLADRYDPSDKKDTAAE